MYFVVRHVSNPYISTTLTFELKMRSLVGVEISLDFHMLSCFNAVDCRVAICIQLDFFSSDLPPAMKAKMAATNNLLLRDTRQ